ncbi:hypothetical protein HMPREF9598_02470 [Cutibacterium acnes HL050PA1]|nr:hypothetical protein HMPREF9598_02470 [Cutibacterium acnes HL050PA1]EGF03411.1 hypothetical protein HMPREF9586_01135 [Cutibacterium acnes HL083PA2]
MSAMAPIVHDPRSPSAESSGVTAMLARELASNAVAVSRRGVPP